MAVMRLDTKHVVAIWCAVTLLIGVCTLAYREHLNSDAHWITKTLCDDKPVVTGNYGRCLEHYAPAAD
jgi:hypothetical protein